MEFADIALPLVSVGCYVVQIPFLFVCRSEKMRCSVSFKKYLAITTKNKNSELHEKAIRANVSGELGHVTLHIQKQVVDTDSSAIVIGGGQ